jgi:hypothetical protein
LKNRLIDTALFFINLLEKRVSAVLFVAVFQQSVHLLVALDLLTDFADHLLRAFRPYLITLD